MPICSRCYWGIGKKREGHAAASVSDTCRGDAVITMLANDYAVENVVLSDEGHHRQRRSKRADALIAGAYFAGTTTRRVRRALAALFGGAVGKDTVSRVWRKAKGDWDAWNGRSLADEPIARLILDGTVARVRLDRQATSISLLVALGVRQDGQKILLAVKSMGGESEAAWRALDDVARERGGGRNRLPDGDPGVR